MLSQANLTPRGCCKNNMEESGQVKAALDPHWEERWVIKWSKHTNLGGLSDLLNHRIIYHTAKLRGSLQPKCLIILGTHPSWDFLITAVRKRRWCGCDCFFQLRKTLSNSKNAVEGQMPNIPSPTLLSWEMLTCLWNGHRGNLSWYNITLPSSRVTAG